MIGWPDNIGSGFAEEIFSCRLQLGRFPGKDRRRQLKPIKVIEPMLNKTRWVQKYVCLFSSKFGFTTRGVQVFDGVWNKFKYHADPTYLTRRDFWEESIEAVKKVSPDFIFMAEVYWGFDTKLQQLGFDYTYNKEILDRLVDKNVFELKQDIKKYNHSKMVHFIENHDEERSSSFHHTFSLYNDEV